MATILFVISSDLYVRNYLRTGVLESLRQQHRVDVVCQENLELLEEIKKDPSFIGTYEIPASVHQRRVFFFHVLMWRFRKRSKTFLYRWQRMAGWGQLPTGTTPVKRLLGGVRLSLSLLRKPRPLMVALCGSRVVFPIASWVYQQIEKVTPRLRELISRQPYDLVVFPSAAFETVIPDLVMGAREAGIPSLSLIDNWDNLTSKTVYWHKPDHLGVWGEQAKQQAIEIHDFSPEVVHPIGTPRFDSYFLLRDGGTVERIYEFPYVLFVGSALPFDEIAALHLIESTLDLIPGVPGNLKIVYRPHPWQQIRQVPAKFTATEFQRTILDKQIQEAYDKGVKGETTQTSFQPELAYYPRLLSHATVVIGPLTTMLFEGALCLRPIIALSYPDGHHFTTNRRYLSHFDGLEKVPGFKFCDSPLELETVMESSLRAGQIHPEESDQVTEYFLYRHDVPYTTRLEQLIHAVISD